MLHRAWRGRAGRPLPELAIESRSRKGDPVPRALRSNRLWLTIGYVSAILLIARAYA